ncbi:hypothetical protein HDU76_003614 [Blyttiomyces sp. JEL0837]|nr:hypothetical protein HDU76_003614 [Blyttiomyces sp. JEL0837]
MSEIFDSLNTLFDHNPVSTLHDLGIIDTGQASNDNEQNPYWPFVVQEGNLGVPMAYVGKLYRYAVAIFFQQKQLGLDRQADSEKLPDSGRRDRVIKSGYISAPKADSDLVSQMVGCIAAAERHRMNYNVWAFRKKVMDWASFEAIKKELEECAVWSSNHVSDNCAFDYRRYLIHLAIAKFSQVSLDHEILTNCVNVEEVLVFAKTRESAAQKSESFVDLEECLSFQLRVSTFNVESHKGSAGGSSSSRLIPQDHLIASRLSILPKLRALPGFLMKRRRSKPVIRKGNSDEELPQSTPITSLNNPHIDHHHDEREAENEQQSRQTPVNSGTLPGYTEKESKQHGSPTQNRNKDLENMKKDETLFSLHGPWMKVKRPSQTVREFIVHDKGPYLSVLDFIIVTVCLTLCSYHYYDRQLEGLRSAWIAWTVLLGWVVIKYMTVKQGQILHGSDSER